MKAGPTHISCMASALQTVYLLSIFLFILSSPHPVFPLRMSSLYSNLLSFLSFPVTNTDCCPSCLGTDLGYEVKKKKCLRPGCYSFTSLPGGPGVLPLVPLGVAIHSHWTAFYIAMLLPFLLLILLVEPGLQQTAHLHQTRPRCLCFYTFLLVPCYSWSTTCHRVLNLTIRNNYCTP